MKNNEIVHFNNLFGTVTNKKVIINHKKGTQYLPIHQISSISYQYKRNTFFALFFFILSIVTLASVFSYIENIKTNYILYFLIAVGLALLIGISYLIGYHHIQININGIETKPIKVEISKTKDGQDFVNAIKQVVIK